MSKSNWNKKFFVPKPGDKFRVLPTPQPQPIIIDHINLIEYNRNDVHNTTFFEELNFQLKDRVRVHRLENEDKNLYLGEVLSYATK